MTRPIEAFRARAGAAPDPDRVTVEGRRQAMIAMAKHMPPAPDLTFEAVTIAGITCEWVRAPGTRDDAVVVWAHGGGFSAGNCFTHRGLAGEIARYARARVLTVDYRLAPEHPFPAARDDMVAVYRIVAGMAGLSHLAVAGDSAGGALALSLVQAARDAAMRQAEALVLFSPFVDLRCNANAYASKAGVDCMIHPTVLRRLTAEYLGGLAPDDGAVSPVLGDLSQLPPMLVQVGSDEVLLDDALLLDQRARAAGAEVTLEVWAEMVHVFQAYGAILPEAPAALQQAGRFLERAWA